MPALCAESFSNPYRIPTPVDPAMVAVGNLNSDSIADFVWEDPSTSPVTLNVLLSQPGGGWLSGASITFPVVTTRNPECLIADLNNDGKQDLVCASAYQFTTYIHVFLGNGDGTFQPPVTTALSTDSGSWAIPIIASEGDLNGDGFSDLFWEDAPSQQSVILLSDGKGGFKPPIPVPSTINYTPPVAADVNGDGIPDLLYPDGPEVALGKGDGSFGPIANYSETSYYNAICTFYDMERDGHLDAVCGFEGGYYVNMQGESDLIILHGNPDGSFNTSPIATKTFGDGNTEFDGYGTFKYPLAVADLNGDGIPDIMAASGDGLAVLLGGPGLTFSTPLHYAQAVVTDGASVEGFYQSLIFDVNGDGIPDAVNAGPNGI
jgi:hypothetical protein